MASSLASIAETLPENVLPQWQQKIAFAENIYLVLFFSTDFLRFNGLI
jgi:hypothetical protein